jgi:PAS domain-containing protein
MTAHARGISGRAGDVAALRGARLDAVLDAMPDCVKVFDETARLIYINRRGLGLMEAPDLATLTGSGHAPVPR